MLGVLKGINLNETRPSLIFIEYHVLSLNIHWYLLKHGYKLIRRTGVTNWYVPENVDFKIPFSDKIELFRKRYLGTPLRKIQWFIKKYTKHRKFRNQ